MSEFYSNGAKYTRHECKTCYKRRVMERRRKPAGDGFRYCSKCDGAHEYCMDHLYTHQHIHYDNDNLGNAYNKEHRDQNQ